MLGMWITQRCQDELSLLYDLEIACNLIIWASNLVNATLQVNNKHTCDHFIEASIKTITYLNGLHGGWMGP